MKWKHDEPRRYAIQAVHQLNVLRIEWHGGTWATQFLQRRMGFDVTNPWADIFTNPTPTPNPSSFSNSIGTNNSIFYRIRVNR